MFLSNSLLFSFKKKKYHTPFRPKNKLCATLYFNRSKNMKTTYTERDCPSLSIHYWYYLLIFANNKLTKWRVHIKCVLSVIDTESIKKKKFQQTFTGRRINFGGRRIQFFFSLWVGEIRRSPGQNKTPVWGNKTR